MADEWFYAKDGKSNGPEKLERLLPILAANADWPNILVWRTGLSNWQRAADVPELAVSMTVPPPLPSGVGPAVSASSEAERRAEEQPKIKKRSRVAFLGTLLIIALGSVVGRIYLMIWKDWKVESMFLKVESKVRPTLPQRLDSSTTLVGISHQGRTLRWELVVDRNLEETARATPPSVLKTAILPRLCPGLRKLSEYDLTYEVRYKPSMEGRTFSDIPAGFVVVKVPDLADITITMADCRLPSWHETQPLASPPQSGPSRRPLTWDNTVPATPP